MNETQKLKEVIRLSSELNKIHDVDILLETILKKARDIVNADAGTIYVRQGSELVFSHAQNDTHEKALPQGKKTIYSTFKVPINLNSIAGYVASKGELLNIPDVYLIEESAPYHFNSSFDEKTNYRTSSMLTVPLINEMGEVLGILQIINAHSEDGDVRKFNKNDELYITHFANIASMVLQRAQMTRALLLRMINMAELRDPKETGAHVNRVASYSVEIYQHWARNKGIPEAEININRDILRMAAMLHDVGKVAISDLILKKPARFTPEEYEVMKTHTWKGAALITDKQSEFDEIAAEVALTHHENWDGTGYPGQIDIQNGTALEEDEKGEPKPLKGEEIPIWGRVVALADVYDALSTKRVYKEAWGEEDVLEEIRKLRGTKFDPDIVDVFFECLDMMRAIQSRYPDLD